MAKVEQIPDYGDYMTIGEFIDSCHSGAFTDSDGIGNYAIEYGMFNEIIKPSDIFKEKVKTGFSHVVWFNNLIRKGIKL